MYPEIHVMIWSPDILVILFDVVSPLYNTITPPLIVWCFEIVIPPNWMPFSNGNCCDTCKEKSPYCVRMRRRTFAPSYSLWSRESMMHGSLSRTSKNTEDSKWYGKQISQIPANLIWSSECSLWLAITFTALSSDPPWVPTAYLTKWSNGR